MRLDDLSRKRCASVGLDPDEMDRLCESANSISPVLVRITQAELAGFDRAAAGRAAARASGEIPGEVPGEKPVAAIGVGNARWRRRSGSSSVLTVRLDHDEVEELRRQADLRNIGVSVLARAYIRTGLAEVTTRLH